MRTLLLLVLLGSCGGGATHQRGTTTDETYTANESDADEQDGPETPEEDPTDPAQDPQ